MYAVRTDDSSPGRPVARLHPEHPARLVALQDVVVYDDVTDWTDDVDLSLDPVEPPPAPRRRRRSSPLLVALFAVAFLMMLGLGALGALVLGAAAVAAVLVLVLTPAAVSEPALPPTADLEPPAIVAPAPAEAVAPPAVEAPAPAPPAKRAPAPAKPAGTPAPAEGDVDAQLVVMPDPGFRSQPVDQAIRKLHERAGRGELGAVSGR